MSYNERFIESNEFPVDKINKFSAKEKGPGRPPFWDMVFWWTRKPLIGARAVVAASLLPAGTGMKSEAFMVKLGIRSGRDNPHRNNPQKLNVEKVKLLDPFAGFGSIPLEALRLGVGEVTAIELLPTAYVFLKAVLEYPKLYGEKLADDVERWGNWITERLKQDPDIKELYDENVAAYIGTWEIKCPHCKKYTPLVGSWWLARSKKGRSKKGVGEEEEEGGSAKGVYKRLAWMEPLIVGDRVMVKVRDLNSELHLKHLKARVNTKTGTVEVEDKDYKIKYKVPTPNVEAKRETAKCLYCNNIIGKMNDKWLVKRYIEEWNERLEAYLRGGITLQELAEAQARPVILAKVIKDMELRFEHAEPRDTERLLKAVEKLKQMWGDPDIPIESTPPYATRYFGPVLYGINKWYKLFNPRQLLTLVKLVKLIREVSERIEEELVERGRPREETFRYAEAVTTYLAIALAKYVDYNSVCTHWHPTFQITGYTLAVRGISMMWNWVDENVFAQLTGSWVRNIETVKESIVYLVRAAGDSSSSKLRILLDDATRLSRLKGEKFDLIVTDPPYADDVAYAELSDLYYVWLKRALSDVREIGGIKVLNPHFHGEAFFSDGECLTQWTCFSHREVSEDSGRVKYFAEGGVVPSEFCNGGKCDSMKYFKKLLSEAFKAMTDRLKDDGLLVTYYSHSSPEAWEALLEAWRYAGLRITAAHALATEMEQRVIARGKSVLDMSIVAVWRKGVSGEALVGEVYAAAVNRCRKYAEEALKAGRRGVDLFISVLGCMLSEFTRYKHIIGVRKAQEDSYMRELVEKHIYPATAETIALTLGGNEFRDSATPESILYMLAKTLVNPSRRGRRKIDRSTFNVLLIGTRSDRSSVLNKLFKKDGKEFELLEPVPTPGKELETLRKLLSDKGFTNPDVPDVSSDKSPIDVLHLLEYYALKLSDEDLNTMYENLNKKTYQAADKALKLAKVLWKVLPEEDPEKPLISKLLERFKLRRGDLRDYLR